MIIFFLYLLKFVKYVYVYITQNLFICFTCFEIFFEIAFVKTACLSILTYSIREVGDWNCGDTILLHIAKELIWYFFKGLLCEVTSADGVPETDEFTNVALGDLFVFSNDSIIEFL